MSAETPPQNSPEEGNAERNVEKELSPEELRDIEHRHIVEAEQFQAAKEAAAAADAEKLAEVRKKLNLENDAGPIVPEEPVESEYEPIPFNKSAVLYEPPVTKLEFEVVDPNEIRKPRKKAFSDEVPTLKSEVIEKASSSKEIQKAQEKYESSLKENAESIENALISWEEAREPKEKLLSIESPHEGMAGVDLEALHEPSEGNEKMREGMEDHVEALSEKNTAEAKEYKEAKEKEAKKKEAREKLISAAKNGAIAVGLGAVATGAVAWSALSAGAYLYGASPLFSAAAGLSGAGFLGGGALGVAAAWLGVIAIQEFFKAGGFKALFSSFGDGMRKAFGGSGGGGGGGKAPAKKPAGGGGGHH